MSKVTLTHVTNIGGNPTSAATTINNNVDTIQAAFDNTLSRNGTSPNQMQAALDMNSNRVLNLPQPLNNNEPVRLIDLANLIGPISILSNGPAVVPVASRAILAALNTSTVNTAYLSEAGRQGTFVWDSANHSADVTADPLQGLFVAPASAPTGASGAWVRQFSGPLNVKWFGAGQSNAAADLAAVNSAGTHAFATFYGPTLYFPRGNYFFSAAPNTFTLDGTKIVGDGPNETLINHAFAGTLFTFHRSGDTLSNCGFEGITISGNPALAQAAVSVSNVSQFSGKYFSFQNLSNASSIGLVVNGRELMRFTNFLIEATIPVYLSRNPDRALVLNIDADFIVFKDGWTITDGTTNGNVQIASGLNVTNLRLENISMNKGSYGLVCIDNAPLPETISTNWQIVDCRWEQADNPVGVLAYIDKSLGPPLYTLKTDTTTSGFNGYYLRNVRYPTIDNYHHENGAVTNRFDFDATVIDPEWNNCWSNNGVDNIAGLRLISASGSTGNNAIPTSARYSNAGTKVAKTPTYSTYRSTIIIDSVGVGAASSAFWPFTAYTLQYARITVSSTGASGSCLFAPGGLLAESGSTNFATTNTAGKLCVIWTSNSDVHILNNLAGATPVTVTIEYTIIQ